MLINKLFQKFLDVYQNELIPTINYCKFNPDCIPGIKELICKMGRHDYEPEKLINCSNVELRCVWCAQAKHSNIPIKNSRVRCKEKV